jgi:hypothetical protein
MSSTMLALAIAAAVVVAAGVLSLVLVVKNYLKYRGESVVNCPETRKPAGVRLNAIRAALQSLSGRRGTVRLEQCSRWPEREQCGQECVSQIQHDSELCHVSAIAEQWYAGRACTLCGKPIAGIHWDDQPPALINEEHYTLLWNEVRPENLQQTLETHLPICWSCHMAETFRRRFPARVADRAVEARSDGRVSG